MDPGKFIVLEGIDGAGTSTQAELLANWMKERQLPVHLTREPSGGRIGQVIREWLSEPDSSARVGAPAPLSSAAPPMALAQLRDHALALLFAADRLDHLARELRLRQVARQRSFADDRAHAAPALLEAHHVDRVMVLGQRQLVAAPGACDLDAADHIALRGGTQRIYASTDSAAYLVSTLVAVAQRRRGSPLPLLLQYNTIILSNTFQDNKFAIGVYI